MSKRNNRRNRNQLNEVAEQVVEEVTVKVPEEPVIEEPVETTPEPVAKVEQPGPKVEEPVPVKVSKKVDLEALKVELRDLLTVRELDEWPVKSLLQFQKDGTRVPYSNRGNYRVSRIRSLNPSKWSVEELMDYLSGDVVAPEGLRDEAIMEEIYYRWKLPMNFTTEAVRDYVLNYQEPAVTEQGILIEDRRRPDTKLTDLTYAELCAIYIGDIPSEYPTSEVKRRIMMIARTLDDDQFDSLIDKFKNGDTHMSALSDQIIGILEARKELYRKYNNRVTDAQLANNTIAFYNTLRNVTKANYAEFAETYRTLLKYVDSNYSTIFHPTQIRRGWSSLQLSPGNVQVLDRLLTLMCGTRNPATRHQDAKQFQLDYILENVTNPKERENIITFYSDL